jgi:ribose transport system substrate-binding protein
MKIARGMVVAGLLALAVAGCGKEETPQPPPSGPPPSANGPTAPANAPADTNAGGAPSLLSQADLDKIARASKPYKIALIVKTRNNPFFDPMIKAAEAEAKALGCELDVQAPAQETDKERQFAMVQDVTAKKVDAILIAPADSKGIVPALKQAQDAGILVVNLDNRVDPASAGAAGLKLSAYVGADNLQGGQLAGKTMAEALKESDPVAVLEGIRGADNAEARKNGFMKAIDGKLDVAASDTAEWDTQKAYAKFQSMLAAHPDLKGLFCANDKMALGAIKALAEAGKKGKLTVIGYDNIPDVKPYLQSGELFATIEQHPDLMGKYGVRAAVGLLDKSIEPGKEFLVPLEVIKGGK